jgi:hypothetical protein
VILVLVLSISRRRVEVSLDEAKLTATLLKLGEINGVGTVTSH